MRKTTKETLREYDKEGNLVKETITETEEVTEDSSYPLFPYPYPVPYPNPYFPTITYTTATPNVPITTDKFTISTARETGSSGAIK